jgi:hypothetical protein
MEGFEDAGLPLRFHTDARVVHLDLEDFTFTCEGDIDVPAMGELYRVIQ